MKLETKVVEYFVYSVAVNNMYRDHRLLKPKKSSGRLKKHHFIRFNQRAKRAVKLC